MTAEPSIDTPQVHIDIVSDLVCPWCFVGKRHLDAALARFEGSALIRWLPFFLNPDTPPEGEPYRPFLENKFGGAAAVETMWARASAAGQRTGIDFAFEKIALRANTLAAHRLIYQRQARNQSASALVERIFTAGFCAGRFIGSLEVLAELASTDDDWQSEQEILNWLKGTDQVQPVIELEARIRQMGISGVPLFIFNGKTALSGAEPPEILLEALQHA